MKKGHIDVAKLLIFRGADTDILSDEQKELLGIQQKKSIESLSDNS